jgi:hypothetical protein
VVWILGWAEWVVGGDTVYHWLIRTYEALMKLFVLVDVLL